MKTITLTIRKTIVLLGLLLSTIVGISQTTQTFNASGTWTCPAGVTTITVEAWGAGGAGGGNESNRDGGGGGGGGAYSKSTTISVTPGVTYTVNVGTGGNGTTLDGTAGGDSWFDSTTVLLAKGGAGGISGTLVSGAAGGNGGAAGSGVGTTKFSGGRGGAGRNNSTGRGGPGGSSAGTAANGTAGAATWSTIVAGAAPAGGGIGGDGGDNGVNGSAGTIPGGGGGGAGERVSSSVFTVGGDGADGRVILSWTCSATHNLTSAATVSGPICQGATATVTLRSTSMVSGTYTVTYNLSGGNTATGNTATMTFTAGSPGTGTFTTPALSNAGSTTITVTALALGTGCPASISANNTASVTVNSTNTALLTSAVGTNSQTRCINTAITNITYATTGATGATFSGLPAGVSGVWASNVATISGTPTASGTFNYTVTLTGGCGTTTATGTINVSTTNTATLTSAVGTNNQTTCINAAITNITYATTNATGASFSGLPAGVTGAWASNVVTISGIPTASGSFSYTVTLTGGCGTATATGTINVTAANTVALSSAVGTNNQTRCINTAITNITYTTTGATGATFSGLPAGVTGAWASNVVTISGAPTTSGTFNYTVTLTGGCGTTSATGTIIVTPANTASLTSAVGTNNQTSCINTAITNITYATTGATGATFSGLPAGVNGTWASNVVTISGAPTASGTFNYTVTLTGGCGTITALGTINVPVASTITLTSAVGTNNQTRCINTAITNITYATTGATGATFSGLPAGVSGVWASNVVTISGTPTASGTFNYTVTLTGACGSTTGTITVTPVNTVTLTSAVGTNNQTPCITTAITNITYATTGATGATFSGLPAGVNGIWASNVVTISGTPTASGTFNYTVTLTGGCGTTTATGTINVATSNTVTLTSAVGTNNQTRCINTAITNITYATTGATGATFSGLPTGVNGTWASNVVTISGTPTVSGTFNYTVTLTGGCGTITATGTINSTAANTATLTSAVGTNNQTACILSAITNITYSTSGATGATFSGLPVGVTGSWASNVVTISGIPTVSGTFNYTVTLTGGCGSATAVGTIIVRAIGTATLSSAIGTNSQTRCINTAITNITYATTVATGATFSGLPSGVNGVWASNVVTISGTPTVSGTFNYTVTLTGACGSVTGTITVTPANTATLTSAVGTNNQSGCVNSAITNITYATTGATGATFSGLPAGVTGAWASNVVTISGTPTASGTFNYTVTLTGGCGTTTASGTIIINTIPTIISTTPGSRTGTGTVLLSATASHPTINWYDTLSGGTALGSGTSFTTPTIASTTTFYVEAVNGPCSSTPRTAVVATVNYPEIDIQGNATSIINGDSTPSTSDWTAFGTANSTRTFTIRNIGSSLLTVGTVTISGANAGDFTVTTNPSSTVAIGSSTTFVVTFAPTAVGLRTATISIDNNDTDENPYTFDINGTGVEQEIDIQGNSISINNGDNSPSVSDWTDFSSVAGTRTFTIRNTGNIALTIGSISFTGVNASEFTVTSAPSAVVGPNSSTTFVVAFAPTAINSRTATINIANNDSNESVYTFALQGFGVIPEIDIQGNAISIPDSTVPAATTTNWTDFSSVTGTRTFTIFNNGNIALTVGAITFSGTNASEFTVTTAPSATVAAFSSTSFVVTFTPTAVGTRSAVINIVNNDSTENPYNFNLQGTGTPREIDVQGLGLSIASGDLVTSVSDGTDFGPADINLATVTRTFTIRNTGSLSLTISNPTISGVNASEFSISANPGTLTIGAGSSTTFSVTFNPSAVFTRSAQINITNNDSDENPYTFGIQGTGLLDNDGDGIENNTDQDDDNDGVIDTVECGTCISDPFVNGSFETPVIGTSTYAILPTSNVTGWQTSAEDFIEIWSTGFSSGSGGPVPAAAGNQFAELNANVPGVLYQTFCLNGAGGTINWAIKHRGRSGTDTAYVKFGDNLTNALASSPIVTMVDGNTSWGSYSGTYTIPVGQTNIVLTFQAGPTASGSASVGNFIDDVQIIINQNCLDTDGDAIADIVDVDSDNDGIPDIEEAGFKAYSNNTATMDKTNVANWRDTNTNGLNDYIDSMISATTYVVADTDGDGIYNHLDLDSDNDTLWDVDEAGLVNGDGDINDDGKGDGLDTEGDGLLNLFDNSTAFGSTFRAYAQDSDGNGISDYLQLDANDDGVNDIQTGLYGSFDTNGDGKIDGSGDADRDGILDIFDTNDIVRGSPRDLDRKLYLDFDGRNDYAENTAILGGLSNATLMAWIDLNSAFSGTGTVVGQDKFHIKISSARTLQAVVNGTTVTFGTALNKSQWYHVAATYGGGSLKLYLNGKLVATQAISGNIAADASKLTLGKDPLTSTNYFKGKIDEVRVFNTTLTNTQVERMVYQEIQNTASQVRGAIVPKDVGSLPFANVLRYYRMDTYKDDIVDDLTTTTVDTGTGMKLYNHKVINYQQAPMPFTTIRTGTFSTAVHDATKDIRGLDVLDFDYSIIQVKHNITETANSTDLALFIDPGVTVKMTNDTKLQNDWYLDLDGKIDLVGKSQLVQTINSDLEVTSAGSIERDQSGQSNKYNYNYWSSPVGALSTTSNNNSYTVDSVMKDGTDPNNIKNITWVPTYDGAATSPITLSSYWIFKFQNVSPVYANWARIGQTGSLLAGQGFTMKGSAAGTATQNYTFVGKPNSGAISSPIAANNLNLSGNPYPSALDANAFINDNLSSITGTLYFWEHFSTNNSHILVQYQGGYATRNLVGGTAPVAPAGISTSGSSTKVPGRYIPVGQGFFVSGSATGGTINFNNGQRAFIKENDAVNSNALFRQAATSIVDNQFNNKQDAVPAETEFTKIRLGFISANDFHRQLLLGFMDDKATSGIDAGYDANLIDVQPNDMYFLNTNTKLVIQGDSYFNTSSVFPLGVKTAVEGKVKFTLDATEKLDENQNVYIYDNVTNEYHDIRNQAYEVNLPAGTISDRFSLRFKNTSSLGVDNFGDTQTIAVAFTSNNNSINIKNDVLDRTVKTVTLYNILGQSISTWDVKNENQSKIEIPVTNVSAGTYIVKVHTTKGDVNKKIIIK